MRATLVAPALVLTLAGYASFVNAQTTAGSGTTLVIPVTSQSASFVSEVTVFNPGPTLLTASVKFYEANNSSVPGSKNCNDLSVSANRSVQFQLATQCALGAGDGSRFGLIVITDKAVPPTHAFYGYSRVQNPQGIGFSVEGFPVQDFNNQVSHATGLKKQAATPTYQTNCFIASLDQAVSYELKLFNDATGAQIGGTLAGSLQPFQQFRYLDVFGPKGVNAPAGDRTNVRAQFTQTSGGSANLIGFCTVQDNMSFGADFRIAKSFGSPSGNLFAQGGNAFGTTATLGTSDNQPLNIKVNNQRVMRYEPNATSPNVLGGHPNNSLGAGAGQTIGGGGAPGNDCLDVPTGQFTRSCGNHAEQAHSTISGGQANIASSDASTVGGGRGNTASNIFSTVAGGVNNVASGFASAVGGGVGNTARGERSTVAGGSSNLTSGFVSAVGGGVNNIASGDRSTVPGGEFNRAEGHRSFAAGTGAIIPASAFGSFLWSDSTGPATLPEGAHDEFVVASTNGIGMYTSKTFTTGCFLIGAATSWVCTSDRNVKENFVEPDARDVLRRVSDMPIQRWNEKGVPGVLHMGPTAQDFHAAFGLGEDELHIGSGDLSGVALVAIQGLNAKVEERVAAGHTEIAMLKKELAELRERVSAAESLRTELAIVKAALAELQRTPAALATK